MHVAATNARLLFGLRVSCGTLQDPNLHALSNSRHNCGGHFVRLGCGGATNSMACIGVEPKPALNCASVHGFHVVLIVTTRKTLIRWFTKHQEHQAASASSTCRRPSSSVPNHACRGHRHTPVEHVEHASLFYQTPSVKSLACSDPDLHAYMYVSQHPV